MRVLVAVLAVAALLAPARATAHPSDLDTLTLDLLLDRGGLVLVDGAANQATYDDRLPREHRAALAEGVLDALGVPRSTVEVDPTTSLLYHEVGFTVWLHEPFANGAEPGEFRLDSRPLQAIAAGSVGRLHLDVCRVASPDQMLTVDASVPASAPDRAGAGSASFDRRDCQTWTLRPDDAPVTITARATPLAPAPPVRSSLRLSCGQPSDRDPTFVRAGAIALRPEPLHARATGDTDPAGRLVAEAFVLVRNHTGVALVVPHTARRHVLVGTRGGVRASARVQLPSCPALGREWLLYPIDFWVDVQRCVPIIVETAKTSRVVRIGVGAPCAPRSGAPER